MIASSIFNLAEDNSKVFSNSLYVLANSTILKAAYRGLIRSVLRLIVLLYYVILGEYIEKIKLYILLYRTF